MNKTPENTEPTHVDDWIDKAPYSNDDGVKYAGFVLYYRRLPAVVQMSWEPHMKHFKLFCDWKGQKYKVTGASRMGDVWLAVDLNREHGYDHRVNIDECTNWRA